MMKKMTFTGVLLLLFCMTAAPAGANTFAVTNNSDENISGSLRWAVLQANANAQGGDHIINVNKNVKLIQLSNVLDISSTLTLNGNGVTLQGSSSSRVLNITGGQPRLEALTFTGGNAQSGNGGAVSIEGNAAASFVNCTFFGNSAGASGGAVYINSSSLTSTTAFINCTIAGNEAVTGSGVAISTGTASFLASIVAGNTGGSDVDCAAGATIANTGHYNVIGSTNAGASFTSAQHSVTGASPASVFLTTPPALETVDGVQVVKLSTLSDNAALDLIPAGIMNVASEDERGAARPQLLGVVAGAFEVSPIPAVSIELTGSPYIQRGHSETYTVTTSPTDATRNTSIYQDGIEWDVGGSSVISVDRGVVTALQNGTATLSARLHSWTANNQETTTGPVQLQIHVGDIPLPAPALSIDIIPGQSVQAGQSVTVTPKVTVTLAGYEVNYPYSLSVSSQNTAVGTAVASADTIVLTGGAAGSSDIAVTATASNSAGSGTSEARHFTFMVSQTVSSKGGGGCNAGLPSSLAVLLAAALSFLRRRG